MKVYVLFEENGSALDYWRTIKAVFLTKSKAQDQLERFEYVENSSKKRDRDRFEYSIEVYEVEEG